jgi:3-hydroxyacyl-CoA dehydrogenase/enoyl-CoA hydratase/3-hydroxybutyryl-CoA epimerase
MRKIRVKAEQAGASDGDGPDEHTSSAVTHRMLMLSPPGTGAGRRRLRVRGRPRHGQVVWSRRDRPADRPPVGCLLARALRADALRRGARSRRVPRRGRDRRRRQRRSLLGTGFPAWTGGVLQCIDGYEGGLPGVAVRARELHDSTASASIQRRRS